MALLLSPTRLLLSPTRRREAAAHSDEAAVRLSTPLLSPSPEKYDSYLLKLVVSSKTRRLLSPNNKFYQKCPQSTNHHCISSLYTLRLLSSGGNQFIDIS
ncbi:hypothetical protein AAHA92_01323 [Salvia divinorum]|uniref:Uncharacterized protein n=1 Tax=Salvia divinorum TaxID=28513 RepID=A0ABD1IMH8_SALDI